MIKFRKYLPLLLLVIVLLYGYNNDTIKDQFQKMKTLTQIIRLVADNYVEDGDMNDILEGAIIGLLDRLDPHSSYISAEQFELINEQFIGEFEGIGIEFNILDGYITVISPIPGTPSDRAGLISGDKIVQINDISAYKITQKEVMEKLRGPKGTPVDVTISRPGLEDDFNVTLVRDKIPIVSVLASFMIDQNTGYGISKICTSINDKKSIINEPGIRELLMLYYFHMIQEINDYNEKQQFNMQYKNFIFKLKLVY